MESLKDSGLPTPWRIWSSQQILENLPDLIDELRDHFDDFPDDRREDKRAAIEWFDSEELTAEDVAYGGRNPHLASIAFAMDYLGRQARARGETDRALRYFQRMHEIFRGGNSSRRPTGPMRQALWNGVETIFEAERDELAGGRVDLAELRGRLTSFVETAWGSLPPQIELMINELLVEAAERIREERADDADFLGPFISRNVSAALSMELPTRLEPLLDRWQKAGEIYAPEATGAALRAHRRPRAFTDLLAPEVVAAVREAVAAGDPVALGDALSGVADDLEENLLLRLESDLDYTQPNSEVRFKSFPDRFFVEARDLLLRGSPDALDAFRMLHRKKSSLVSAKEWCAYALIKQGGPSAIHEIIELLEAVLASPYFSEVINWAARWNLACALHKLAPRRDEALGVLLPVLNNDIHPSGAFEACLAWAIAQNDEPVVRRLLGRARFWEAHLLAFLHDLEESKSGEDGNAGAMERVWPHFVRIAKILENPDQVFPDPRDARMPNEILQGLTEGFIDARLAEAGVEWFSQRLSYGLENTRFKNWECAARLYEEIGDREASWRCRRRQWGCSRRSRLTPERKRSLFQGLMGWGQRNGFQEDALRILRSDWRDAGLEEPDVLLWEKRLGDAIAAPAPSPAPSFREVPPTRPAPMKASAAAPPAPVARAVESLEGETAIDVDGWSIFPPSALGCAPARPMESPARTRLFARLVNRSNETISRIEARFGSGAAQWSVSDAPIGAPDLPPGASAVIEAPAQIAPGGPEEVVITLRVESSIAGSRSSAEIEDRLRTADPPEPIPESRRCAPLRPLRADEKDFFRGREGELAELARAYSGDRMVEIRYVNGIRRVGKTSLMNQLEREIGDRTLVLRANLQSALSDRGLDSSELVRRLCRQAIENHRQAHSEGAFEMAPPGAEAFEIDPPWVVFGDFLNDLRRRARKRSVLLGLDEFDAAVRRIAEPDDPLDDALLGWLRERVENPREGLSIVLTGSEPFETVKSRLDRPVWKSMRPLDLGFLSREATEAIAVEPMRSDGVRWLPEALERLWDETAGYPCVIQSIVEQVAIALNSERRRVALPGDVDRAARRVMDDVPQAVDFWWSERDEGPNAADRRRIATLILQHQPAPRAGVEAERLASLCRDAGVAGVEDRLREMERERWVLARIERQGRTHWRISGGFLERRLSGSIQRSAPPPSPSPPPSPAKLDAVALLVDWENVKLCLEDILKERPPSETERMRARLSGASLGARLVELAAELGPPRQRWAVANWDRAYFAGDQMALSREANFHTEIAGSDKANASDHVLRQKIQFVLEHYPQIECYILVAGDADFAEDVKALLRKGKRVVLWATRHGINSYYKYFLKGPDRVEIGWIEDLVFGAA